MLIDINVPHHQQNTYYYCGAACAQMVLSSIGAGLQDQDTLYTDARNHTSELASWYNPPDGLQWLMNDRRPASFAGWFALYSLTSEDAQSRKIVWTLHHYQVAPIALVHGGDHILVVRGCDVSAAPSSSADVGYTITSFDVNNPWPPLSDGSGTLVTAPPPPHSATDGCGSGGNRGVANENIAYSTWAADYMTANKWGTLWKDKFVAICDPDPPASRLGVRRAERPRHDGDGLIRPEMAIDLALSGAKEYGLLERKSWARALARENAGTPILVQRLDRIDSFYYIAPFADKRNVASAAVSVDARSGHYRESIAVDEGRTIPVPLDAETIWRITTDRWPELPGRQGRLRIRKEAFCLYPTMVWRPCRESLSPYFPFHMITVGRHRIYVRIDGRVFTRLHTNIPGI